MEGTRSHRRKRRCLSSFTRRYQALIMFVASDTYDVNRSPDDGDDGDDDSDHDEGFSYGINGIVIYGMKSKSIYDGNFILNQSKYMKLVNNNS
mmetsp:Transcript_17568/g.36629  ORF Transcript_17568/g.36629 Transcript_17568/m.36629 type:complete len:93 (+) Transcript_17568:3890-4168(+)